MAYVMKKSCPFCENTQRSEIFAKLCKVDGVEIFRRQLNAHCHSNQNGLFLRILMSKVSSGHEIESELSTRVDQETVKLLGKQSE